MYKAVKFCFYCAHFFVSLAAAPMLFHQFYPPAASCNIVVFQVYFYNFCFIAKHIITYSIVLTVLTRWHLIILTLPTIPYTSIYTMQCFMYSCSVRSKLRHSRPGLSTGPPTFFHLLVSSLRMPPCSKSFCTQYNVQFKSNAKDADVKLYSLISFATCAAAHIELILSTFHFPTIVVYPDIIRLYSELVSHWAFPHTGFNAEIVTSTPLLCWFPFRMS